jgi:GntR family transcriptional repressor for pyruvate dehydrogenase complex
MSPSHLPTSLRTSALAPIESRGRVGAVERRLAEAIQMGVFADGEQLPSEVELATQLGVATVTLREALVALRRTGLVQTRRGRNGGSFVRAPQAEAGERLLSVLRERSVDDLRDAADHHAAIAGTAAALAAERASPADLARLEDHVERLAAAATPAERRAADGRFHVELAAAARSLRLTRAEMDAQAETGALVWLTVGDDGARAVGEHREVLAAVAAADAEAARRLTSAHVAREMAAVIELRLRRPEQAAPTGADADAVAAVAGAAERALDDVFAGIDALRERLLRVAATARAEGRPLARADLQPLSDLVHEHLRGAAPIAGTGVVFAGEALADAALWLEWWRRSPDGAPAFLAATLDPRDPDFYDYARAEWFTTPRDTGDRWVAGPFVDYSGTNEHIFTLTLPVTGPDGFLGVAGADLAVGEVEAIVGPSLGAISADAVVVNHRNRVIASNTPRWLVGTLWSGEAAVSLRVAGLPWTVVVVA